MKMEIEETEISIKKKTVYQCDFCKQGPYDRGDIYKIALQPRLVRKDRYGNKAIVSQKYTSAGGRDTVFTVDSEKEMQICEYCKEVLFNE